MNIKGIFKTALPFLTAALPGPLGPMATALIAPALGLKEPVAPDRVEQAISEAAAKDPTVLTKLKEIEAGFKTQMTELGYKSEVDLEQIAAEDRASARQREIVVKDKMPMILAITVNIGFFGVIAILFFRTLDPGIKDVVLVLVGVLGAKFGSVYDYFFGSSSGSSRKTEMLAAEKTS